MACLYDGISLQNQRPVNMDSLLMKERAIDGRSVCMAVVCDGVGSMTDGAFAASSAVRQPRTYNRRASTSGRSDSAASWPICASVSGLPGR